MSSDANRRSARRATEPDLAGVTDPRLKPHAPMTSFKMSEGFLGSLFGSAPKAFIFTAKTHPEFYAEYERMCARAGVNPPPTLALVNTSVPNASAHGRNLIVVHSGLFKKMTYDEALAVIGHELGHTKHDQKHTILSYTPIVGGLLVAEVNDTLATRLEEESLAIESRLGGLLARTGARSMWERIVEYACVSSLAEAAFSNIFIRMREREADAEGTRISERPKALISALGILHHREKKDPIFGGLSHLVTGYPYHEERVDVIRRAAKTIPSKHETPRGTVREAARPPEPMLESPPMSLDPQRS